MFRNYLKTALRSFWRNKFDGSVNLLGLTIGITGCLLIALFVRDEWRFDRFVPEGERIYRVYNERIADDGRSRLAMVPMVFAPTMQRDFPEVDTTLRMMQGFGQRLFRIGDEANFEDKGHFAETHFFDFFGLPLLDGDPARALTEPNQVVLTQSLARKYFGDESPVGKAFRLDDAEATITGVVADPPEHFHLDFRYLMSFATLLRQVPPERQNSWVWQQFYVYLKLIPGTDGAAIEAKLEDFAKTYAWPQTESNGFRYIPHLQALHDIHLHSADFGWDVARRGNITHVWGLSIIGLFLLVIAIINFINLATARAERRAREVGVRKVVGAGRRQLIAQFSGEAVLMALLATLIATQLVRLFLPPLNTFTGKSISLTGMSLTAAGAGLLIFAVLIGLLAGLYPAFFLSAFRPVRVLKGRVLDESGRGQWLRRGLVVVQFALTVLLIAGSLVVFRQVNYLTGKDYGFDREHVLYFALQGDMGQRYETVKQEFLKIPGVSAAATAYGVPGDLVAGDDIMVPGQEGASPANVFTVDHDYLRTMGLGLVAGRDFSRERPTDTSAAFVINETAVRELGFGTPEAAIGQRLDWNMWGRDSVKQGQVIGVVRDFHYSNLYSKIGTAVLHIYPEAFYRLILRIRPDHVEETLAAVEKTWDSFQTGYPFDYQFIDESFAGMYEAEGKLRALLLIFTALTIFVACLGLLGLAMFAAEQRTKEIGIRKVLGAGVGNIVGLLAGDFLRLVLLAVVIATPPAWYFLSKWLESFAYRIELSPWIFAAAAALAIAIALLTVSFHSLRAATANPVRSLRSE